MKKIITISLFLTLTSAYAVSAKKFPMKDGKISLVVPEKWESTKGLFGVQVMLLGPMISENRPVVTIDSTDFEDMKFDAESLKKNEVEYKEGRELWLKKYNGKSLEYFPYQVKELKSKSTDHNIGYRYELGANEFVERSHYITCNKNLYHFKILIRAKEEKNYTADIEKMMNSFSCQ
jgi:hypothetical protein